MIPWEKISSAQHYFELHVQDMQEVGEAVADSLVGLGIKFRGLFKFQGGHSICFSQDSTGVDFVLCPGGRFVFGLDTVTFQLLRKLLTRKEVRRGSAFDTEDLDWVLDVLSQWQHRQVEPFLVAQQPVRLNEISCSNSRAVVPQVSFDHDSIYSPTYFTYESAERLCDSWGWQIPSESQWECAAKCWTHSLYCVDESELLNDPGKYLSPSVFDSAASLALTTNRLGLLAVGVCLEWTSDDFVERYSNGHEVRDVQSGDRGPAESGFYGKAVRGGAGDTWPWQFTDEFLAGSIVFRNGQSLESDSMASLRPVILLRSAKNRQ